MMQKMSNQLPATNGISPAQIKTNAAQLRSQQMSTPTVDSTSFFTRKNYRNEKGELLFSPYTTRGAATIGGLIGAALGGLGGYAFAPVDEDSMSEDEKFKKRLKSALLGAGIGLGGGAGIGYGVNKLVDQVNYKPYQSMSSNIIEGYFDSSAPVVLGSTGTVVGAMVGAKNAKPEQRFVRDDKGRVVMEDFVDNKGNVVTRRPKKQLHTIGPRIKRGIGGGLYGGILGGLVGTVGDWGWRKYKGGEE